jgi:50S ribosomal protein L16 3-hydroxylase
VLIMSLFGNISIETFLKEYWQQKPLLIRNAFPDFKSPIDPDELAGLALEEDIESRIILEDGPNTKWELENGPFKDERFETLPDSNWTLLVQAVDQWVPEMADILQHFKFLPSWRLDDIMASFAPKGGSVGPHYDQYDVFLLQAEGQRRWQLGPKCKPETELRTDSKLSILSSIHVTDEWTVNPGDLLYIPPMYAHNGVAENDCTTFSIGFRAPSEADILQGISELASSHLTEFSRYSDQEQGNASAAPALIDEASIDRVLSIIKSKLSDDTLVSRWLAESMTESKYEDLHEGLEDQLEWDEITPLLTDQHRLTQNETTRWAYFMEGLSLHLYINGCEHVHTSDATSYALIEKLANNRHIDVTDISNLITTVPNQNILLNLINSNYLYFDELGD